MGTTGTNRNAGSRVSARAVIETCRLIDILTWRYVDFNLLDMPQELTLAELADASGLQSRTIRSWVAQGLLPGPLTRGPLARYPADQLERILAIRAMKDIFGMSLTNIRRELLVATAEQLQAWAGKAVDIAPESSLTSAVHALADPGAALDYFHSLRSEASQARIDIAHSAHALTSSDVTTPQHKRPASGFEALERRLMETGARSPATGKARSEQWITIGITPDVELSVRGQLDPEQRARLERCAELMRDILTGRD